MNTDVTIRDAIHQACDHITKTIGDGTLELGRIADDLHQIRGAADDLDHENQLLTDLLLEAQADAGWTPAADAATEPHTNDEGTS